MTPFMDAIDFEFENMPVKLVTTRKIPRINTAGHVIEEVEAGGDLTVKLWMAWELMEAGLARLADDGVSGEEWTQIHYRERFQPLGRLSSLPEGFYSRAYLTFKRHKRMASEDSTRLIQLRRLQGMFRDIVESRIGKIVRLASAEAASQSRALQPEEAALYRNLRDIISSWREEMKKLGAG